MFRVSVLETRSLLRSINRQYGIDLSGRSMASLRLRLSEVLDTYNLADTEQLISSVLSSRSSLNNFLRDIAIGSPDMFRDPDFWVYLKEKILPGILNEYQFPEFVIPDCITGNELYSLKILLKEADVDFRVDVRALCENDLLLKQISTGELSYQVFKNSRDNYDMFNPGGDIKNYIEDVAGKQFLVKEVLDNIKYSVQTLESPFYSDKTAIVLYRNRMIYQTPELQYKNLKTLLTEMREGTYLITGIQESIDGFGLSSLYETISSDLKIYRKINVNKSISNRRISR